MRRALLVLAVVLGATACEAHVFVGVDVDDRGGGRIEAGVGLDDAALARLGDLGAGLRVDDLRAAGWEVTGPRKEDDGRTWVRAERRFATPDEGARAFAELAGAEGPFRELRVSREQSLFRTTTRMQATVDLTAGLEAFSDPGLRERLGGQPFGVDRAELERQVGAPLDEIVSMEVVARLPGDVDSNAPDELADTARWQPEVGTLTVLEASSARWNTRPLVLAAGSGAAGALLLAVLFFRLLRRRRGGVVDAGAG